MKKFKVYVTTFPNGDYYIGFSSKVGKAYDDYYGSSKSILTLVKEHPDNHGLVKTTIESYDKKGQAKLAELMLQLEHRFDPKCINDMVNVRLRLSHLDGVVKPDWQP